MSTTTTSSPKRYSLIINRLPEDELIHQIITPVPVLPKMIDLRSKCPPIYDQGELGSCTANACACIYQFGDTQNKSFMPSRLFIYYNERILENDVSEDAGATLSDGIKTLQTYGVCPENLWTYDITKFAIKPPVSCYVQALNHKAITVTNIKQDITSMKNSLVSGYPFIVGVLLYSSFESDIVTKTGVVPMPLPTDEILGGHAVVCVGYNDTTQQWIMRNSWGTNWGVNGYFYLPYAYLLSTTLTSDLWNITKELNK